MYNEIRDITIDITEACNLKCEYCFTYSNHKNNRLDENLAHIIIDDFINSSTSNELSLAFWGGEPLLEWDLLQKLTKYAYDQALINNKKISFNITTNGTLLTEEKYEFFRQYNYIILVSYDGIQESHDICRKNFNGLGSWETVYKNLLNLQKCGIPYSVRTSLSVKNVKYFYENIKHIANDLKLEGMAFSPVYEDDWNEEHISILKSELTKIENFIIDLLKNENRYFNLRHINEDIKEILKDISTPKGKSSKSYPCGAGNTFVGISVDGVMFPCHRFNKHGLSFEERLKLPTIYGAYIDGKFTEIKNSDLREQIKNYPEYIKTHCIKDCKKCSLNESKICILCHAVNYDINKNIFIPTLFECEYFKIQYESAKSLLLKIIENRLNVSELMINNTQSQISCGCYMASYNEPQPVLAQFLDLSRRIIESKDLPKSEEQQKLEQEVLEKTILLLQNH